MPILQMNQLKVKEIKHPVSSVTIQTQTDTKPYAFFPLYITLVS